MEQSVTNLRQDLTEYLQEESKHLPPRQEVEDFFTDISELRDDVERLEIKINSAETAEI
jgi:ubiquinone biosynthesis protein UbiJ